MGAVQDQWAASQRIGSATLLEFAVCFGGGRRELASHRVDWTVLGRAVRPSPQGAPVAHRTERAAPDRKAGGSIPSRRTIVANEESNFRGSVGPASAQIGIRSDGELVSSDSKKATVWVSRGVRYERGR